ncbi:MAG: NAD(P)H-hydrate dehydratase [Armatimonadetes bacterium]|nr:NAD(P)H-hydrate dehydratase [Armatimonadota bacterium]
MAEQEVSTPLLTPFPLVTASESRQFDQLAEKAGLPSLVLMENAALRIAEVLQQHFELDPPRRIVIVCGRGNNGGDGMALARHLSNIGFQVQVFLLSDPSELKGDAATNYQVAVNFGVPVQPIVSPEQLPQLIEPLRSADLVVDALLGTGITGEVRGLYAEAIPLITHHASRILSVDIPSGINSDTGEVCGVAVKADATVTLGAIKLGLMLFPGADYAGDLFVGSLGVPDLLLTKLNIRRFVATYELVHRVLPPRHPNTHKGDYGLSLIGGAPGMTGAAIMAGKAALRTGAGLAQVALPQSLNIAVEASALEVMSFPLPETDAGTIAPEAINVLEPRLEWADVIAIGCGISRNERTQTFVRQLVAQVDKPMVIDADGLIALAGNSEIFGRRKSLTVLTPHPGEMAALLGTTTESVQRDRVGTALKAASEFKSIVVLKGARTITASFDGTMFINPTGNAGMATGGSGDVLTGMIAALLAQTFARQSPVPDHQSLTEAVAAAVFLHGLAGDIASWEKGEVALIAGDLLDHLPRAINEPELAQPLTLRPVSPFVRFVVRMRK